MRMKNGTVLVILRQGNTATRPGGNGMIRYRQMREMPFYLLQQERWRENVGIGPALSFAVAFGSLGEASRHDPGESTALTDVLGGVELGEGFPSLVGRAIGADYEMEGVFVVFVGRFHGIGDAFIAVVIRWRERDP